MCYLSKSMDMKNLFRRFKEVIHQKTPLQQVAEFAFRLPERRRVELKDWKEIQGVTDGPNSYRAMGFEDQQRLDDEHTAAVKAHYEDVKKLLNMI